MSPDSWDDKEFAGFLGSDMGARSGSGLAPDVIVKDLVASKLELSLVYLFGAALGYCISLAICAQCSIGLSPLSWKVGSMVHMIPDPWCPIVCGTVFGISPTLVSLLYFSRFQHRFLLFRMKWLPVLVPIVAGFTLLLFGDTHGWAWQSIWLMAAVLTPYLVEVLSGLVLRQGVWARG